MPRSPRLQVRPLEDRVTPAALVSFMKPLPTTGVATAPAVAAAGTVQLSAAVASPTVTVGEGTETFAILSGPTTVGTPVTVPVLNGVAAASYTLPTGLAAGAYTVKATYTGTTHFAGNTAPAQTLTVAAPSPPAVPPPPAAPSPPAVPPPPAAGSTPTTVGVVNATGFAYPSPVGSAILASVATPTVTASGGPLTVGSVTVAVFNGTVAVGNAVTVGLPHTGSITIPLPTGTPLGTYTLHVTYNGSGPYASSSNNTHTLTIISLPPSGYGNGGMGSDPNDIVGPVGSGPSGAVSAAGDWAYHVEFENDGTGSARAIDVTGQLDPSFDPATFRFNGVQFGDARIDVPGGATNYHTVIPYHNADGTPIKVAADFNFDNKTGRFQVDLTSLDAATGKPLSPHTGGLLPPNVIGHIGEGFSTSPPASRPTRPAGRSSASRRRSCSTRTPRW